MESITMDLNLSSLREYSKRNGCNESTARYKLKKMHDSGLMKVFPKVPSNKKISFNDILNNTTGYPLIDNFVLELKEDKNSVTSDILRNISEQTFNNLIILPSKFLADSNVEEESKDFTNGLIRQVNLLCTFCNYKETKKEKMDFEDESFRNMLNAIILETRLRQKQIKEYYFKLSDISHNTVKE